MPRKSLHLSGDLEADRLLSTNPLALLIGLVLDQQISLEKAFAGPAELARRLGQPLEASALAEMDPDRLVTAFAAKPALHRYPASMAARVQDLCRVVAEDYGGEAANVWRRQPDGATLLAAVRALPGFGEQKARIFVALLGKQLGVRPKGWEAVSKPFGEAGSFRSIADIVDPASLARVRVFKQQMKEAAKAAAAGASWELASRRLYLCTPDRPDLEQFVAACIVGGVDVVQLRDKELAEGPLMARAAAVRSVCAGAGVPFVLNDRPDLALAAGADGVHVGQDDPPPSLARELLGATALVGRSTHGVDDLERSLDEPVDYISAGPVTATPTKPGRPGTGEDYLELATARSRVPVFVTGGVTPERVAPLARHGARHFVVVRWLTEAADPAEATARARALRDQIDRATTEPG